MLREGAWFVALVGCVLIGSYCTTDAEWQVADEVADSIADTGMLCCQLCFDCNSWRTVGWRS